jgi:hypothetical protein
MTKKKEDESGKKVPDTDRSSRFVWGPGDLIIEKASEKPKAVPEKKSDS